MTAPLRARIFSLDDRPRVPLEVPEWDCTVYVRSLTGAQRDELERRVLQRRGPDGVDDLRGMRVQLVIWGTCDQAGAPLFTDDDQAALADRSGQVIERLAEAVRSASGLGDDAIESAEGN